MVQRREFLKMTTAALTGAVILPGRFGGLGKGLVSNDVFDAYARRLLEGFVRSARRTAPGYAVCDYSGGTLLKSCTTPSGKTYVSVARILPLLSEWLAAEKPATVEVDGEEVDLRDVAVQIFRNAFDPAFPHYWGEPPPDRKTQRSVEAALVADALWRMREPLLERLSSRERSNVQRWLASCTRVPERDNNHAWFHCINQSARLRLSERWPEFEGDEAWMRADLEALDALYGSGGDGWYSDSPKIPIYDFYNFWTFGNFPLLWTGIAGERYPEWQAKFRDRARLFLETAPYFYAPDGSQPWFGRSLLYRWAALSPLLLGYRQGAWPHSPGLLRRIVRTSLDYHWRLGAFDPDAEKLRETFSATGTPAVRDTYIDNGSPYWATLGMLMYSIPASDPFWTAPEEPLPVERGDYRVRFEGPRMMVLGTRASGQVRWIQARAQPKFWYYRDLYTKFVASSHFPFNVVRDRNRAPWDAALLFRNRATGNMAGRVGVIDGELLEDGVRTRWFTELDGRRIEVLTRVRLSGEFEGREHVLLEPGALRGLEVELLEGSHALGLEDERYENRSEGGWRLLRSPRSGHAVATRSLAGYEALDASEWFDEDRDRRVNLVYPRQVVNTLAARAGSAPRFASLHYASPRPLAWKEIRRRGEELAAGWGLSEGTQG
ncbi:MAG TPA: DUF2264 domain-containing protein [Longimicrobiaceae bacterium]|nr:DUF2264 domain-containing protein [Longimicrobiaceae bacterium]